MEIDISGGIKLKLKNDNTASVIKSENAIGDVFIPRTVEHQNKVYTITSLSSNAFYQNNIQSITFPDDSEVDTFEKDCLINTQIKKLQIPAKLKNLQDGWCWSNEGLTTIEISPNNQNFIFYDDGFLLGKSSETNDTFDILYLARSDIKEAVIPPQVKIVKSYSFFAFKALETIIFPDNSETKCIEVNAFWSSNIKKLKIAANLEDIHYSNFDSIYNLNDIEVSPQNKVFSLISGNLLVKKSNPNNLYYDKLVFCYRDAKEVIIPSYINEITNYAFYSCQILNSLTFQPNSTLLAINYCSFYSCDSIKSIVFPESVIKFDNESLLCMRRLESILFLGKVIQFGFNCLSGCKRLKSVSFPNALIITFESSSLDDIPRKTKINVLYEAKLIGVDDDIKQHINYRISKEEEKEYQNFVKSESFETIKTNSVKIEQNLNSKIYTLKELITRESKAKIERYNQSQKDKQNEAIPTLVFGIQNNLKPEEFISQLNSTKNLFSTLVKKTEKDISDFDITYTFFNKTQKVNEEYDKVSKSLTVKFSDQEECPAVQNLLNDFKVIYVDLKSKTSDLESMVNKKIFNNYSSSDVTKNTEDLGGNIKAVLRFSIQWNDIGRWDQNDLDAHCIEPNDFEIMYNRKVDDSTGGNLNVDITNPNKGQAACENIVWTDLDKMKEGTYRFFVRQYCYRDGHSGFRAHIAFENKIYHYDYRKTLSQGEDIDVAYVTLQNGQFSISHKLQVQN